MTDSTPPALPAPPESNGPGIQRYLLIGLGGFAGLVVIGFLIALLGGLVNSDGVSNFFRILRDFFIIVLALQGILISAALIILVIQVSAFINLLRRDLKPIVDETRETLATVRGTATFVSQNVTQPVIRASAFVSGTRALITGVLGVRRNVTPPKLEPGNSRNGKGPA
ncbi:MAG: hypothetical protein ACYDBJ_04085 [Aggregatilineales bacterium]